MSYARTFRTVTVFAITAAVVVISAGCGSTVKTDATTTTNAGVTTGEDTKLTGRERAVKFAECMRQNGVPDFPDPDASGAFPSFGISVTAAVWKAALAACKTLQPPGSLSAHMTPTQFSAALKFAQCMRTHGVPDFPDPVNGQPLIDTYHIPSANRPGGMTILNAAGHKCAALLKAAMEGR